MSSLDNLAPAAAVTSALSYSRTPGSRDPLAGCLTVQSPFLPRRMTYRCSTLMPASGYIARLYEIRSAAYRTMVNAFRLHAHAPVYALDNNGQVTITARHCTAHGRGPTLEAACEAAAHALLAQLPNNGY